MRGEYSEKRHRDLSQKGILGRATHLGSALVSFLCRRGPCLSVRCWNEALERSVMVVLWAAVQPSMYPRHTTTLSVEPSR